MLENCSPFSQYKLGSLLYEGPRTCVCRAIDRQNNQSVIIKFLRNEYPSFKDILQLRNQYAIATHLINPGIVRPQSLEPYQNGYAVVMEDCGSISLAQYLRERSLNWPEAVFIVCQLADILHYLHQQRVIHKDIKPANILIHPKTEKVKLIDFSIASLLPKETQEIQNPNLLEGTLAYIAPEQTGRMNRGIDYRADFYSLGVTFYELLAKQLPFQAEAPLELVHAHLARRPVPPSEIDPSIPPLLSAIALKLMAKNAEDRYQSAFGLKYDLERILQQWQETSCVANFELGQRDLCDRFTIPEKLYGRESEVAELLAAFARVSGRGEGETGRRGEETSLTEGQAELLLVAGFSGIGKTAVINEVHKPITRQKGYFIQGKFDQFNRNIPFSAFVCAFRDLMAQLLSESDAQLQDWKAKILEAVGENGSLLIEVLPELERIIGPQPKVPELAGTAAQNRFNLLFQHFIAVFARLEHPLVIFLDDLQWADLASLGLLKLLLEDSRHLLLLGAYRDNEVSPVHPLILTVEELLRAGKTVRTIALEPLHLEDTTALIADTLHCSVKLARPLSEFVQRKTQGNPFFMTQFLKALQVEGEISFARDLGYWQCDLSRANARSLTEDVVEFMAAQLQKLPPETQAMLKLAACIGNRFDLETLATISERRQGEVAVALWNALQEGSILPQTDTYKFYVHSEAETVPQQKVETISYRFLHDRVQQAAYSLIPSDRKAETHYRIGKILLQNIAPERRSEQIFELVSQLNRGIELIEDESERQDLAQLNLMATRKARVATAYQAGWEYARRGLSLLGEDAWERDYETALELHDLAAELASLCGDFEAMERLAATIIDRARAIADRARVYLLLIRVKTSQNQLLEAMASGRIILAEFGVTFPETPTPEDMQQAIARVRSALGERRIAELVDLPEMQDPEKIALLNLLVFLTAPALQCNYFLFVVLACRAIELSLANGNSVTAANSYQAYGVLSLMIGDIKTGIELGELSLAILRKFEAERDRPDISFHLCLLFLYRSSALQGLLSILEKTYVDSLEIGDISTAAGSLFLQCNYAFWSGISLSVILRDTENYIEEIERLNQSANGYVARLFFALIRHLLDEVKESDVFTEGSEAETDYLSISSDNNNQAAVLMLYVYKTFLHYILGDFEEAERCARKGECYTEPASGFFQESVFYFYSALTALGNLKADSEADVIATALERALKYQTQLSEQWARYAPMNFQHKVELIEAEKCRVLGRKGEAIEAYDRAIAGAKINEYLQEEALALELAARFYLEWDKPQIAADYLQKAYYAYSRWGAKAKIERLEKTYPQLLAPILQTAAPNRMPGATVTALSFSNSTNSTSSAQWLDLPAIMRAAQTLSEEIELDKLLACLMDIVLTNAGAERGHLILHQEGSWQVVARADSQGVALQTASIEEEPDLPKSVIYATIHSATTSVFDNLAQAVPYNRDPDILHRQPLSALCTPLLHQRQFIGLLYLENNLTLGAFTPERLEILQLLASQAAISLENAHLYQETQNYSHTLEIEVERQTEALHRKARDLEQALKQLQQTQAQLIQTEKMSSLGQLVAGIAHEINNPVNFINGNIPYIETYVKELIEILKQYRTEHSQPSPQLQARIEEIELDFLFEDASKILDSMKVGSNRISAIVLSLRNFSRLDEASVKDADLQSGLDSTLLILQNRLQATAEKPAIQVFKDYGNLPKITCYPGQLNQVFLNILSNAIDAIRDNPKCSENPEIRIRTRVLEGEKVEIAIANTDSLIPEALQQRILEPFFTTKAVGRGTGLGLFVSYSIVQQHQGTLTVRSHPATGTEFAIVLPLNRQ